MGYLRSHERSVIRKYLAASGWKIPSMKNTSKVYVVFGRKSGKTFDYETVKNLVQHHKLTILKCWLEKVLHVLHLDKR